MKNDEKKVKPERIPTVDELYSGLMYQFKAVHISPHKDVTNHYLAVLTHFEDDHHTIKSGYFQYYGFDFAKIGNQKWIFAKGSPDGYLTDAYDSDIFAIQIPVDASPNIWDWGSVLKFTADNWEWRKSNKFTHDVYDFSSSVLVQMKDGSLAVSEMSPFFGIKERVHKALEMNRVSKRRTTLDTDDWDRVSPHLDILFPSMVRRTKLRVFWAILEAVTEELNAFNSRTK